MLNIKWQTLSFYLNVIFAEYFHLFFLKRLKSVIISQSWIVLDKRETKVFHSW